MSTAWKTIPTHSRRFRAAPSGPQRSGERKHEAMSVMAKPLLDADIDQLAVWFSAVRVEASSSR